MPLIRHLYLSPGHNYFGHHGQAAGTHEIEERNAIELVAGRGIRDDRFFDFKPDYKGQVTLFDQAIVEAVREHADHPSLPSSSFRRNVILEGVDLNALIGKTFRLGKVLLQGSEECKPCYWMDEACGKPGTEELLKGHGGLRCRILEGGWLRKGGVAFSLTE